MNWTRVDRDCDCAESLWYRLGTVYHLHRGVVGCGDLERRENHGQVWIWGRSCVGDRSLVFENQGCGRLEVIAVLTLCRRLLIFEEDDLRNWEVQRGLLHRQR